MDILSELDSLFKDPPRDFENIINFLKDNGFVNFEEDLLYNFECLKNLPEVNIPLDKIFNLDRSETYFQLIDLRTFNRIFDSEKKIRTTRYV